MDDYPNRETSDGHVAVTNTFWSQTSMSVQTRPKDCLACRVVGTGAMGGVGAYALWQSRAAAQGAPWQKRVLAGLGVGASTSHFSHCPGLMGSLGFIIGGVFRWKQ